MLTINALKGNGLVENVQSRWLGNAINCKATKDVIYAIAQYPDVLIVGYDKQQYVLFDEDPRPYISMRGLPDNITQVNADDVWNLGFAGKGVIVAVIDSGVNYNHLDVKDHLWDGGAEFPHHGYDIFNDDDDPMDEMGHGSHCAGIVCGDGTAGTQIGMAPNATLMCIKVLGAYGEGSSNMMCAGVDFAVEHGADIFSMSLGIRNCPSSMKILFRNTMVNALATGIVGAVAAGNEGDQYMYGIPNNVRCPGSCPPPWIHPDQQENSSERSCVVCVGAVNQSDNATYFTSHGPVTWQNIPGFNDYLYNPGIGLIRPDVCAPGVNIVSLDFSTDNGYIEKSGTSMATPCVAGVMALLMSKNPDITPAEMDSILETKGLFLTPHKNNATGSCRVDALAATQALNNFTIDFVSYSINDSIGNGNGLLNPDETVSLKSTFINKSDESINNVKIKLTTDNQSVTMIADQVDLNFTANESITVDDAFKFKLLADAPGTSKVDFLMTIMNSSDTAYFNFSIIGFDYLLNYNGLTINDEMGNNDSIWNPGEKIKLNIYVENIGNEPVMQLDGILSTDNEFVSIDNNEVIYHVIPKDLACAAVFEATLDEQATSSDVEFALLLTDLNGRQTTLNISTDIAPQCCSQAYNLRYNIDNQNNVEFSWDRPLTTPWPSTYGIYRDTTFLENTGNISFVDDTVAPGIYDYTIFTNYKVCQGAGIIVTIPVEMCDTVPDFHYEITPDNIIISWERPLKDFNLIGYIIYKDGEAIANLQDDEYSYVVDQELNSTHNYCIQALYDECEGEMSCLDIYYIGVDENPAEKINVYPNPSNDIFVVEASSMTRIIVYDSKGIIVKDLIVNADKHEITGLPKGIYFLNVQTKYGTFIEKIVRL